MKLQLKHLAPYLPYELKCSTEHGFTTMESLCDFCINGDHEESYSYEDHPDEVLEFKPMLRPLFDLKKEIDCVDGKIIPIEFGCNGFDTAIQEFYKDLESGLNVTPQYLIYRLRYDVVCALFRWHFDVFNLIPEGLAIKK